MRRARGMMSWPFAAPVGGDWSGGRNGRGQPAAPDHWGAEAEAFPGAAALADVRRGLPGGEAAARLAVVRLALAAAEGRVEAALLERERAAVRAYLCAGGCPREEAAALEEVVSLAVPGPAPALARALCQAAAAALAGGSAGGAESLWRTAYAVAAPRRWHTEVVSAAEALAALARAGGSRTAALLWRQRAQRHRRRLPRDEPAAGE